MSPARTAKSLLLVVLGEFVWPTRGSVWSSTLLAALGDLGVDPTAARKAIQRTADDGVIEAARSGRRVQWAISDSGEQLLTEGFQRVLAETAPVQPWDGRWLWVSVTVPELHKNARYQLQRRLEWAGLGTPAPGEWLTPHVERSAEVRAVIADLGLEHLSSSFVGTFGEIGDERALVRRAWDLDALQRRYEEFTEQARDTAPRNDRAAFRARIDLVQAWRPLPYADPELPQQFLPDPWAGRTARALFQRRRNALLQGSQRHWDALTASAARGPA